MKFSIRAGVLQKMYSRKRGFRGSGRSESYTLPKGVNEFMYVTSQFLDRVWSKTVYKIFM